jgi:hypothetical protein
MYHRSSTIVGGRSSGNLNTGMSGGNYHSHQTAFVNPLMHASGSFPSPPVARKVSSDRLGPSRAQGMPRECDASSGCAATSSRVVDAHSLKDSKTGLFSSYPEANEVFGSLPMPLRTHRNALSYDAPSGCAATSSRVDNTHFSSNDKYGPGALSSSSHKPKDWSSHVELGCSYSKVQNSSSKITRRPFDPTSTHMFEGNSHSHQIITSPDIPGSFSGSPVARKVASSLLVLPQAQRMPRVCDTLSQA